MRHVLILSFLLWNTYAVAQLNGKYTFRHIDQTDGLLHTMIRGVGQDTKGFIWILTPNGLQRYDGTRLINYPEVINRSSFSVMHDSYLYVDTLDQQIWVIKGDRMEILDLASNTLKTGNLEDVLKEDNLQNASLFHQENGNQWFIGENGLISKDIHNSTIISSFINVNPAQPNQGSIIINDPKTGNYWFNNFNDLFIADVDTRMIDATFDAQPKHPLLKKILARNHSDNRFRYMLLDSDRNIWISTWTTELLRYNLETDELFTYSLRDILKSESVYEKEDLPVLINAMMEDRQKHIWFATDYCGLLLYDRDNDGFQYLTSDERISNGLRYNFSIESLFQDRDDNIWLGTDRGINIFNPYQNPFQTIRHIDGNIASLPKQSINDVMETNQGEIWVATWGGGISVYDNHWNFIRQIRFPGPVEYNLVWSFIQLDDGRIWAGTQHGYIHEYNPITKAFVTLRPDEVEHSTIRVMAKDQLGNIYLGLQNGKVTVWDSHANQFFKYNDAMPHQSDIRKGLYDMIIDKAGLCWIGVEGGLQEFDVNRHAFKSIYLPDSTEGNPSIAITCILDYGDSTLLVGTIYHGLYFFNKHTKVFSRDAIPERLKHISVYGIKKDQSDNIWFTSDYSLYKLGADLKRITQYPLAHDGIQSAFESGHFYPLRDGRWVARTPAELICFNPLNLTTKRPDNQQVEICGFKLFSEYLFVDSFLTNGIPVSLSYNQNFISIEFSVLDFAPFAEVSYYYRLNGLEDNWTLTSTRNFADYTDLKPGHYAFEVKADLGGETSLPASLSIIISPPWWGTLGFRILAILCIGLLIWYFWKKRILAVRKASELKHRIAETEMMALRSQMNPHFIFNCINSIDAMIQSNDKYRATVYLNKFAKLIRNVLDSSKENRVTLSKDMDTLQLYLDLELFRHQHRFSASIQVDGELMQGDYKVPPLIIQPYVENAILHGLRHKDQHEGRLLVTVSKEDDYIVYLIEDNGIGRKNKNGESDGSVQGYGMQMSKDRVRLFNEEEGASVFITDLEDNGKSSGTRIRVKLKIQ